MSNHDFKIGDVVSLEIMGNNKKTALIVGFVLNGFITSETTDFVSIIGVAEAFSGSQLTVHQSLLKEKDIQKSKDIHVSRG